MSRISQKDIAKALNISRVTVTKALKGHPDIAKDTVRKVKEKAYELGYVPNFIGRALSTSRTNLIGLLIPSLTYSPYAYATEQIVKIAELTDRKILPMVSFDNTIKESANINLLLSMNVDGIIIIPSGESYFRERYAAISRAGIPYVFLERQPVNFDAPAVICDDKPSSKKAILLALQNGYRKIAHFAGPPQLNVGNRKLKGYLEALNEYDLPINEKFIRNVGFSLEDGYKVFNQMMDAGAYPDIIYCWNDLVAYGVYKAAHERNIRIPEDLGVIGHGDHEISRYQSPPLTTIHIPAKNMANYAMEMLERSINNEDVKSISLESMLIIRKSIDLHR